MSDKIRALDNSVKLVGKITEFEYRTGISKAKINYVSLKGVLQFGKTKAESRRFETYVQEVSSKGKESKMYEPTLAFAQNARSVVKFGAADATEISIQGALEPNDYVNSKEMLIEGVSVKAKFFNDVEGDYTGQIDIEGYIQSINPETAGEDEAETGRLKFNLLSADFFGNLVPIRNIIVPAKLKDVFEKNYTEGQTAKFFVGYEVNTKEEPKPETGGIGERRVTEGKSYLEMVMTGADSAVDEDDERGIKDDTIRIGLVERKAKLNEIKEKGYQGKKGTGGAATGAARTSMGSQNKPAAIDSDDEIPF